MNFPLKLFENSIPGVCPLIIFVFDNLLIHLYSSICLFFKCFLLHHCIGYIYIFEFDIQASEPLIPDVANLMKMAIESIYICKRYVSLVLITLNMLQWLNVTVAKCTTALKCFPNRSILTFGTAANRSHNKLQFKLRNY